MSEDFKPHLFVKNIHSSQGYTTPPGPPVKTVLPDRNRGSHGNTLLTSLRAIWAQRNEEFNARSENQQPVKDGEYISFIGAERQLLEIDSIGSDGAKLLNVKTFPDTSTQIATVFIPDNKQDKLLDKISKYINEDVASGHPKFQKLVEKVEQIEKTTVEFLWSGSTDFIPRNEAIWCELWLAVDDEEFETAHPILLDVCRFFEIPVSEKWTTFPERVIVDVKVDYNQILELISSFGYIAEIRLSEELNAFWFDQTVVSREAWINSAIGNITFDPGNNYITIIDSGVNNSHLLMRKSLIEKDRLTVDPNWGINDSGHKGHGTGMAGIALYGNLNKILENNNPLEVNHRLESVKVLSPNGEDIPITECHYITMNAVNTANINDPTYNRIYCMALTGRNQNEFGKPSTWSAVLDKIIYGEDTDDKKIFIVSAGNVRDEDDWKNYPHSNLDLSIESPAQAWNAITVGAYTSKILPDQNTLANKFELSPYSRTSSSWENSWPIKPDVVFEGGNLLVRDNGSVEAHDDLNVLTVSTNAAINAFASFSATSAATAFAANFLAKIRNVYAEAWPETLRALLIHSASWTSEMIAQFDIDTNRKGDIQRLFRIVGYGIPNFQKAIECKGNYLTLISEEVIQPYKLDDTIKTNEIHYYEFPWPTEILENLGATDVTLRVTLSYFIEPNPGEKGYSTKYSYQSCALKFLLKNPGETTENFRTRTNRINIENLKIDLGVNKLEEGDYNKATGNSRWFFGADTVFKGSIHSNYWKGSAADIASCNELAVFPVASGWWKQLKKQKKADSQLRYSLIVSIETPENTADIYTDIVNQIAIRNQVVIRNAI